jgi:nucleoside-diphosphate-sugar epimerase
LEQAKTRHVLVIGGTGFISSFVVRSLVAAGQEVTVFHRSQDASLPPDVRHISGDRAQLAEFVDLFRQVRPEVIVDTIPYTQREAQTLVEVARGLVRRLVVISSVDVYRARDRICRSDPGPPDPTPLTEASPLRDRLFPYEQTRPEPGTDAFATTYDKILVEQTVTGEPELEATIVRLPQVYGPGDYSHRTFQYLKRMTDERPVILLPHEVANYRASRGYVEDVAEAVALCVISDKAAGRVYHVGDQDNLTETEWVGRIGRAAGWEGKIVFLPHERLPPSLQNKYGYDARQDWSIDTSRIRQEMGYSEPTPSDVAMQRTVDWERTNPPPKIDAAEFDYFAEDMTLAGQK